MPRYIFAGAHEAFSPGNLLDQAIAAERAGFDAICCSDHFQPWWEPGESGHAWPWLGAAAMATRRVPVGTAVTAPMHRHHPAMVAQFAATMELMFPGRTFIGLGSGEALNEVPLGMDWPTPAEQLARFEEALRIITALLDGERLSNGGPFALRNAHLHSRPAQRPPLYVSAFHPEAARLAGRYGDGLWTLADPEKAPKLIDVYRRAAADAGRPAGEILLHATFAWEPTEERAFADADRWRATLVPQFFTDDWHRPEQMQRHAQETVDDRQVNESFILGPDPDHHVTRIREIAELGATAIVLMNVSAADPLGAIAAYGDQVLPRVRAATVAA